VAIKRVNFHVLAGMETVIICGFIHCCWPRPGLTKSDQILGGGGSTIHYWLERVDTLDKTLIQPMLCHAQIETTDFGAMLGGDRGKDRMLGQNHVMWGAISYAEKKLAHSHHVGRRGVSEVQKKTHEDKKKVISKLKEAMEEHDRGSSEGRTIGTTGKSLDAAWKRKVEVMKTLKEASEHFESRRVHVGLQAESHLKAKQELVAKHPKDDAAKAPGGNQEGSKVPKVDEARAEAPAPGGNQEEATLKTPK
jgi:hypothetical protein